MKRKEKRYAIKYFFLSMYSIYLARLVTEWKEPIFWSQELGSVDHLMTLGKLSN